MHIPKANVLRENFMKKGKLYGVSVGPGDPELMTLKAARILREADVIALPSGSKERCEAYKIAVQAVPEIDNKEFLMVPMPMTKDRNKLKEAHENGIKAVKELLDRGLTVAFLTIGDVGVYSSCQYIYQPIKKSGEDTELICGVPSFCAAAARLDRPLVTGADRLHIIPATYDAEGLEKLDGVKVLMKPSKNLSGFKVRGHRVCGIENCGKENEKIFDDAPAEGEDFGYYSLFIGE